MRGDPVTRSGVLCVGSVVVDAAKVIDVYPAPERLARVEEVTRSTGGPGLNMAVDLRLLGARFGVGMVGAVGDDENGRFVRTSAVATTSTRERCERSGARPRRSRTR